MTWLAVAAAVVATWAGACAEAPAPPPAFAALPANVSASARLEISAVQQEGHCASPYPIARFRAKVSTADGRVFVTPEADGAPPPGAGTLDPGSLAWQVNVGQFTPDGLFLPPIDLLPVWNTNLVLTVWLAAQPAARAQLVIPPQFACAQYLNLSGRSGALGSPGMRGGSGEPGPAVHVALGYLTRAGKPPLILVRVDDAQGIRARTVLAADGPPLQIFLDGGVGGQGGPPEVVRNNMGYAMAQSSGGVGGDGGDGGAAEIDYDASAPELEQKVVIFNRGGPGGYGEGMAGRAGRPGAIPRKEPTRVDELFRDELAHGVPVRRPNTIERTSKQAI